MMGVWKLSVFRPERKHDTGEFIPLEILKDVLKSKDTSKNNKHLRVETF
ncbi:hypothetical protein PLAN_70225 [Planktothrix rubescens CCAP 1459/22]|uniref:Uncharacterized protein n=1 Tax=Planktothrix rubescens CCAP 1459/22 TaxID=329571 RepID=A0A6J7ZUK0_PLARU|nr:hypothetical protein PLAN_70225 [Planktothrix rubescens NIVA-CYA 18]CAD0230089.1 conserved hypothetical protein [Planktothrix agardhii]